MQKKPCAGPAPRLCGGRRPWGPRPTSFPAAAPPLHHHHSNPLHSYPGALRVPCQHPGPWSACPPARLQLTPLLENFRTHAAISRLAHYGVLEVLLHFFPEALDRLPPETSQLTGALPAPRAACFVRSWVSHHETQVCTLYRPVCSGIVNLTLCDHAMDRSNGRAVCADVPNAIKGLVQPAGMDDPMVVVQFLRLRRAGNHQ